MNVEKILAWQNLIFILPMAFALLLLAVSMMSAGDHDADGHEADGFDAEVSHGGASVLDKMMSAFGLGKVPVSILVFCWCMFFGFSGLALRHYLLEKIFPAGAVTLLGAVLVAFFAAGFLTAFLARQLGRLLPRFESYGEKREDFVFREAEVRYTITATSGTVTLKDRHGNLQQLQAHLHPDQTQNIPPGSTVVLLSYNADDHAFFAAPVALTALVPPANTDFITTT